MNGKKTKKSKPALILFSLRLVIPDSTGISMMRKRAAGKQRDPTL